MLRITDFPRIPYYLRLGGTANTVPHPYTTPHSYSTPHPLTTPDQPENRAHVESNSWLTTSNRCTRKMVDPERSARRVDKSRCDHLPQRSTIQPHSPGRRNLRLHNISRALPLPRSVAVFPIWAAKTAGVEPPRTSAGVCRQSPDTSLVPQLGFFPPSHHLLFLFPRIITHNLVPPCL